MLCKHLKQCVAISINVNTCCYILKTYVYLSIVYSAFKLAYLHKPADLQNFEYGPLHHLSRLPDEYMKVTKQISSHEESSS